MSNYLTTNKAHSLQTFAFDGHALRVVTHEGESWFVASDVCAILGIGNVTMAINRLDEDEYALISIEGSLGSRAMNIVSEAGLYSLILGSRKPEAKLFKRWVTHEVLPSIRKTGRYAAPTKPARAVLRPGKAQITRQMEFDALNLCIEGMNNADIARALGISRSVVVKLVSGRQQFGPHAGPDQTTPELRAAVVAKRMEAEQTRFVDRIQTKYCISAINMGLALEYDREGRKMLAALGAPMPEEIERLH